MVDRSGSETSPSTNDMTVERTSELELTVTRTVNGPVSLVFQAWTTASLFRQWWVPRSYGLNLLDCEMNVRVGGQYRLVFQHEDSTMAFFGTYLEVVPNARLVWTNDEGDEGQTITTVTFEALGDKTRLVIHDRYPTIAARDSGSAGALSETLDQLDELLGGMS